MSAYVAGDPINAIVADIGAYATKIGYAGEDFPRAYFRSSVGVRREKPGDSSNSSSNSNSSTTNRRPIEEVDYDAYNRPLKGEDEGLWEAANPVDPVTGLWYDSKTYAGKSGADWSDLIPTFVRHGYSTSLGVQETSANPLLLVEKSYNPPPIRQQLLEVCMEEMEVPAIFFGRDAALSCYACGRTSGTVVDIGYGQTVVTPVFDGYVEQKGIRRSPIGARAMDEMCLGHLDALAKGGRVKPIFEVRYPDRKKAESFLHLGRLLVAKECRESGAGQSVTAAASKSLQVPSISFTLPDGQVVDVPSPNRFEVAEYVLGRPVSANSGSAAQEMQEKHKAKRHSALEHVQSEYLSLIEHASTYPMDEDEEENDGSENKYTEATAVGISQRRTKRRGASTSQASEKASAKKASKTTKKSDASLFNNWNLQHACASYFQMHTEQLTENSIATMVCDAAYRCDRDQQATLLGNMVLGGGGACIGPTDQAVPDLLRDQVEAIIHTHTPMWRVKVLTPGMQERAISSWLGGSILGSLGGFHEMWITKEEYNEWGPAIVNRKCP